MISKLIWTARGIFLKPIFGRFGLYSYLGKPIFIKNYKKIFIDEKVRILPGSRMEVHGLASSINIHENTSIGQNIHIIAGGSNPLVIKKNTTISANVFISNLEHEYQELNQHVMNQPLKYFNTVVGENCFIGYGSVIQAGTTLGNQCIVGANSVVRGIYPDYCVIAGIPGKIIKRYDPLTKLWKKTNSKGIFVDE